MTRKSRLTKLERAAAKRPRPEPSPGVELIPNEVLHRIDLDDRRAMMAVIAATHGLPDPWRPSQTIIRLGDVLPELPAEVRERVEAVLADAGFDRGAR